MSSIFDAKRYFLALLSLSSSSVLKVIISPKTLAVSARVRGVLDNNKPCLADKYW